MSDALVRAIGWPALILQSDPLTFDRYAWIRRMLPFDLTGVRVLDAGCGNGGFAVWAAHRGAEVVGISDSDEDVETATRRAAVAGIDRVRFVTGDLRDIDAWGSELGRFEHVICLEVIEHVIDDGALIRRLAERLRPGGSMLLSTPTDEHPPLCGEREHLTDVEDGRHVRWGSSPERLRRVVTEAGLAVVRVDPVGGPVSRNLTSTTSRLRPYGVTPAWAAMLPLRLLRSLDPALLRRPGVKPHGWGVQAVKPAPGLLSA